MRRVLLPLSALLLLTAQPAAAGTIYKYVDQEGNVTYTNVPLRGAQAIVLPPSKSSRSTPPSPAPRASDAEAMVSPELQKQRDGERRRILETELANEQRAMADAQRALADAEARRLPPPEQQKRRDELKDRERNVAALQRELAQAK